MSNNKNETPAVRVYTDEEIELFLNGDRRDIDRLIMQSLNNIAAVLAPHMQREEALLENLGAAEALKARVNWIETQIARQKVRQEMMKKVTESALAWALIAFLSFAAFSLWQHFLDAINQRKIP